MKDIYLGVEHMVKEMIKLSKIMDWLNHMLMELLKLYYLKILLMEKLIDYFKSEIHGQ